MHGGWRWTCDNMKQTIHCQPYERGGGCGDPRGGWSLPELGGRFDELRGFNLPQPLTFRALDVILRQFVIDCSLCYQSCTIQAVSSQVSGSISKLLRDTFPGATHTCSFNEYVYSPQDRNTTKRHMHTRTHTHCKTVKYTNGYKRQSARLAKCLSTQHFKRYVLSLLPHRWTVSIVSCIHHSV